jgi:cholesterol 7-dehydrogenase
VREVNRGVYLWHDVDDQPPAWEIPEIADLKRCFFHGVSRHDVNAHIQELPENGADSAHLDALHGRFVLPWLTALTHTWSAKWTPGEEAKGERHLGHMVIHQAMALSGREMGFTRIRVTGAHVGPGVVHLCMRTPLGPVWIIENVTPHAPLLQKTTIAVYAPWTVPRFVAKLLLHSFVAMFERDVPVWSNKTFVSKPMVVKEDGNILEYRRWFSQFYSKDRTRAKPNLDW